jgi:hypothetical protein
LPAAPASGFEASPASLDDPAELVEPAWPGLPEEPPPTVASSFGTSLECTSEHAAIEPETTNAITALNLSKLDFISRFRK